MKLDGSHLSNGILISGKAGSGKDTIGDLVISLAKADGFVGKKYGFANALKSYCSELYDYPNEWNYSQEGKASIEPGSGKKVRDILIDVSAGKRAITETYWADIVIDKIGKEKPEFYVITDCRYKFEADPFKEIGATLVRLQVSKEDRYSRIKDMNIINSKDTSEIGLDHYAFNSVYNNNNNMNPLEIASQIWDNFKRTK